MYKVTLVDSKFIPYFNQDFENIIRDEMGNYDDRLTLSHDMIYQTVT